MDILLNNFSCVLWKKVTQVWLWIDMRVIILVELSLKVPLIPCREDLMRRHSRRNPLKEIHGSKVLQYIVQNLRMCMAYISLPKKTSVFCSSYVLRLRVSGRQLSTDSSPHATHSCSTVSEHEHRPRAPAYSKKY